MLLALGTGRGFTTTLVVAVAVQPFNVTVTVYAPLIVVVEFPVVGFWLVDVNPPGPDHEYVPPPLEPNEMVEPAQYGPVLETVGTGNGFTTTLVVAVAVQPFNVAVTVYAPLIAVVELPIVGFWLVEVNPPGPDHE